MTKENLISRFAKWLKCNETRGIMCSKEYAEYEINNILKSEPIDSTVLYEDDNIFVGSYKYNYTANQSLINSFTFEAIGIGSKENVTDNDYELADYMECSFIIK